MSSFLRAALGLVGVIFGGVAFSWLLAPRFAAASFRMPLLQGAGLTTQVGDLWSLFATLSFFTLAGVWTRESRWFFAPFALLSLAVLGRITAWLFHGAAFTADMLAVEVFTIALLAFSIREARVNRVR